MGAGEDETCRAHETGLIKSGFNGDSQVIDQTTQKKLKAMKLIRSVDWSHNVQGACLRISNLVQVLVYSYIWRRAHTLPL